MFRRDFLKFLSLSLCGCAVGSQVTYINSKNIYVQPYENMKDNRFGIFIFEMDSGRIRHTETEFNVHNIFFDVEKNQFVGINKYGPRYLIFKDLDFSQLKYYKIDENFFNLSGHVTSTLGSEFYYLTAIKVSNGTSCVLGLNKTTNEISVITSLGLSDPPAHDCKFTKSGNELLITSGNKLHFYDIKEKKLQSKIFKLASARSSLRHFSVNQKNEICIQSNIIDTQKNFTYEQAQIVLFKPKEILMELVEDVDPRIKNNELLDFSFSQNGQIFACVHGGAPVVTIWSTEPFKLLREVHFEDMPMRVSNYFDQDGFLVLGRKNFYIIDAKTYSIKKIEFFQDKLKSFYSYGHKLLIQA